MTSRQQPIHLVCGFDEGYAMPAGVMLRSVARSLAPGMSCVAHLVGIDLHPDTRSRLEACGGENLEIRFAEFDSAWLADLPDARTAGPHLNATVFIELLTDRFLPEDVGRYVHLDADMVVRSSLHEVEAVDLEGNVLGAVTDFYIPALGMPEGVELWRTLGLDNRAPYLNSGILVVDRAAWRRAEVERQTLAYLREHRAHVRFVEQEALNVALVGRWKQLHPKWNFLVYLEELATTDKTWIYGFLPGDQVDEARANPAIIHYAGPTKPWHHDAHVAYADVWWKALADTPWASFRPEPPKSRVPSFRELTQRARAAGSILRRGTRP